MTLGVISSFHVAEVTRLAKRWFSPHQNGMLMTSTIGVNGEKFDSDTEPPWTVPACTFCASALPTPSCPAGNSFTYTAPLDSACRLSLNWVCMIG